MQHAVKENKTAISTKNAGSFFGKAPVNSFFAPAVVQPKLTIGPVDDPYEREADTVADRVMRMTDAEVQQSKPVAVQRKCAECEKEEHVQKKEDNDFITSTAGKNIQRSPGDSDTTPGNEESNHATPFLRIRITLHDLYDREDNDMANYGEANIEMIRRGVISPGDYTVPYSALWNNNYQLSTRWGLGRITKNLYEKGDNLLKPIRGIVGKIPLAGGFISSKIKLSKPDLKGGDWDRYIADKTTLTALGGALDRDNPAYNAGSGFTFTINIVDFHFDENRLFRKPVNSNYTPLFQINRKCAQCEEEDKKAQMKSEAAGSGGITAPSIVHNVINRNGQPLDAATRNFMESRMGYDFGNVQIHNDSEAHQSSSAINALAYTSGNHIAFGTGQYQPDSIEGRKLLAHELTHVIQQQGTQVHHRINRFSDTDHHIAEEIALSDLFTHEQLESIERGNMGRDYSQLPQGAASLLVPGTPFGDYHTHEHFDNFIFDREKNKWVSHKEYDKIWDEGSKDWVKRKAPSLAGAHAPRITPIEYIESQLISAVEKDVPDAAAFIHLGNAFHTIEDFFAHSNFVELIHEDFSSGKELTTHPPGAVGPSSEDSILSNVSDPVSSAFFLNRFKTLQQSAESVSHGILAKDFHSNKYHSIAITLATLVVRTIGGLLKHAFTLATKDLRTEYVKTDIMGLVTGYLRPPDNKNKWWEKMLEEDAGITQKRIKLLQEKTPVTVNQLPGSPLRAFEATRFSSWKAIGLGTSVSVPLKDKTFFTAGFMVSLPGTGQLPDNSLLVAPKSEWDAGQPQIIWGAQVSGTFDLTDLIKKH